MVKFAVPAGAPEPPTAVLCIEAVPGGVMGAAAASIGAEGRPLERLSPGPKLSLLATGASSRSTDPLVSPSLFLLLKPCLMNEAAFPTPWAAKPTPLIGAPATPVTIFPGAAKVPENVDDPCRERVT